MAADYVAERNSTQEEVLDSRSDEAVRLFRLLCLGKRFAARICSLAAQEMQEALRAPM